MARLLNLKIQLINVIVSNFITNYRTLFEMINLYYKLSNLISNLQLIQQKKPFVEGELNEKKSQFYSENQKNIY